MIYFYRSELLRDQIRRMQSEMLKLNEILKKKDKQIIDLDQKLGFSNRNVFTEVDNSISELNNEKLSKLHSFSGVSFEDTSVASAISLEKQELNSACKDFTAQADLQSRYSKFLLKLIYQYCFVGVFFRNIQRDRRTLKNYELSINKSATVKLN